jgi:hypothetical protein
MKTWILLFGVLALGVGCGEDDKKPAKQADDMALDMAADLATQDDAPPDLDAALDMVVSDLGAEDIGADLAVDMPAEDMDSEMPQGFEPPVVRVISTGELALLERTFPYKLLELRCGDKAPTYAQWIEPEAAAARPFPVVAMTQPYAGIDWTGEAVDARWAARGAGLHPDDSEPGYVAGSNSVIAYEPMTPQQGGEQAVVHLLNGFGVLHMFGRFYAGGSIQNDVEDMTCGLSYLAVAEGADASRIGTFGGSWGGFEAVYGALYAPPEVAPKVGVALTPLTDFVEEWRHVDAAEADPRAQVAQQFTAFFEPYKRRMTQTTGGAPDAGDFTAFTHDGLAALPNQTRFLAIHDSEDALVPFTMGQSFAQRFGERVEPVWVMSEGPLDLEVSGLTHGVRMSELYVTLITLSSVYLHTALAAPDKQLIIVYDPANLKQLLGYALAQKQRGQGTQQLAQRLVELASQRVLMFDLVGNTFKPGAEVITALVNEVFGTGYTTLTIGPGLRNNGL